MNARVTANYAKFRTGVIKYFSCESCQLMSQGGYFFIGSELPNFLGKLCKTIIFTFKCILIHGGRPSLINRRFEGHKVLPRKKGLEIVQISSAVGPQIKTIPGLEVAAVADPIHAV